MPLDTGRIKLQFNGNDIKRAVEYAIVGIESSREDAAKRQQVAGNMDQGFRSQVTSGGHLDALADVIAQVFIDSGINKEEIHFGKRGVELPGFFRPEKSWDIVVVREEKLIAAIELKSIWSSYGNNMNNRTEEAIGSGFDFQTACRYDLYNHSTPWLGYVFVIRDDVKIHTSTKFRQPHFPVDREYQETGYLERSIVSCRRLMTERVYDRVFYALVDPAKMKMIEPASDMTWLKFEAAIRGRVAEALA